MAKVNQLLRENILSGEDNQLLRENILIRTNYGVFTQGDFLFFASIVDADHHELLYPPPIPDDSRHCNTKKHSSSHKRSQSDLPGTWYKLRVILKITARNLLQNLAN